MGEVVYSQSYVLEQRFTGFKKTVTLDIPFPPIYFLGDLYYPTEVEMCENRI